MSAVVSSGVDMATEQGNETDLQERELYKPENGTANE